MPIRASLPCLRPGAVIASGPRAGKVVKGMRFTSKGDCYVTFTDGERWNGGVNATVEIEPGSPVRRWNPEIGYNGGYEDAVA